MHYFFVSTAQIQGNTITVAGRDFNHIKNVLRMRKGDSLSVCDEFGMVYDCAIDEMDDGRIYLKIASVCKEQSEPCIFFSLFQGIPKSDKMDFIIQKCVELGAGEIIPVCFSRCVVKLTEEKAEKRLKRWNYIAQDAAKQSRRGTVPAVSKPLSFKEALDRFDEYDAVILLYEKAEGMRYTKEVFESLKPGMKVCIIAGPEGGFEEDEVRKMEGNGAKTVTLGKRILRCETAGMYVLSVLTYLMEEC